jgi:hypothetical protein
MRANPFSLRTIEVEDQLQIGRIAKIQEPHQRAPIDVVILESRLGKLIVGEPGARDLDDGMDALAGRHGIHQHERHQLIAAAQEGMPHFLDARFRWNAEALHQNRSAARRELVDPGCHGVVIGVLGEDPLGADLEPVAPIVLVDKTDRGHRVRSSCLVKPHRVAERMGCSQQY